MVAASEQITFLPIAEISSYQTKWTIKARVTNRAPMRTFNKKNGGAEGKVFHIELLDASGGEIRASFFGLAADKFFDVMVVGKCFTFSRGSVKVANKQFNQTNHRYELTFEQDAQIAEASDDVDIKTVHFNFADLRAVQSKTLPCRVDLCGIVTSFMPVATVASKDGRQFVKRDITIADDTATSMTVTLWNDVAKMDDAKLQGMPLVGIKNVLVKEFNQTRSGSVLDSGTLVLQPEGADAERVQRWWKQGGSSQELTSLSMNGGLGVVSLKDVQSKPLPCRADFVGVVTSFRGVQSVNAKDGREFTKREITIADDSATSMVVTLWGDTAKLADSKFESNPLVSLKGVLVKEYNQTRSGSLLEKGSLVFGPEGADAERIQQWWTNGGASQEITQLSTGSGVGLVNIRDVQSKMLPCLVDLCGVVTAFRSTMTVTAKDGRQFTKRDVTIADDTASSMDVTLWGNNATLEDSKFEGNPVVSLRGVALKEFNQARNGSLIESGRLVFQPDGLDGERIRQWWQAGGSSQQLTALSASGGGRARNATQCTLGELRLAAERVGEQPELFSVASRLALVQTRKQGEQQPLHYMACAEPRPDSNLLCNRKLDASGFCAGCNRAGKQAVRLNLRCRFTDSTDSTWLTTFHEAAQNVLGMTGEEVKKLEDEGVDGRERLEAQIKSRYFSSPLQVTIRSKLGSYNGEPRTDTSCVEVRPVNFREAARAMLKEVHAMMAA